MSATATELPDLSHLAELRATIAARAVTSAVVGLVPLPVLDDLAEEAVRRAMLRVIARARRLTVTPGAIANLAVEEDAPTWRRLGTAAAFGSIFWRVLRKAAVVLAVARQGDEAARTFQIGTLFDHYCARLHPGGELDAARARQLRAAMTLAMNQVRRDTLRRAFQHGIIAAARSSASVPLKLIVSLARAITGKPLAGGSAQAREAAVDAAAERAASEGFVAKAARVVSDEIAASATSYLGELVQVFERLCAAAGTEQAEPKEVQ